MLKKTLIIFLFLILISNLSANTMYFMPDDGKKALDNILTSISKAKSTINIAIYSFTNKDIAKALRRASKRNVHINVIFDSQALKGKSRLKYLAKYKGIDVYTLKGQKKQTKKANKWYGKCILNTLL